MSVLQATARIFDPIGFLSQFTICIKCLFSGNVREVFHGTKIFPLTSHSLGKFTPNNLKVNRHNIQYLTDSMITAVRLTAGRVGQELSKCMRSGGRSVRAGRAEIQVCRTEHINRTWLYNSPIVWFVQGQWNQSSFEKKFGVYLTLINTLIIPKFDWIIHGFSASKYSSRFLQPIG